MLNLKECSFWNSE